MRLQVGSQEIFRKHFTRHVSCLNFVRLIQIKDARNVLIAEELAALLNYKSVMPNLVDVPKLVQKSLTHFQKSARLIQPNVVLVTAGRIAFAFQLLICEGDFNLQAYHVEVQARFIKEPVDDLFNLLRDGLLNVPSDF